MPWVRIDDALPDHPKVAHVDDDAAMWLHVCGLCYANRYLTNGFIPTGQVRKLTKSGRGADKLVKAGLWDEAEGGYQIHGYLEYQLSRDKVLAEREAAKKRMAAARGERFGGSSGEQ